MYAIGKIHRHLDLLAGQHGLIMEDGRDFSGLRKVVVHAQSTTLEPEVWRNRIGIGAFATGQLSCLVLEGEGRRFLCT